MTAALKQFVALVVLVAIGVGLFYAYKYVVPEPVAACTAEAKICPDGSTVGRTGPQCEFAACPHGDALFARAGTVALGDPAQPQGTLIFTYPQAPGDPISIPLAFDGESICASGTSVIACIAMNVGYQTAFHKKDVVISGVYRGTDLLVRRMSAADPNPAESTAQQMKVGVKVGQSVNTLGVSITPISVADSRCPGDVRCVWVGTVTVQASVGQGTNLRDVTFTLGEMLTIDNGFVTLTEVTPPRTSQQPISQDQYFLTFEVVQK